MIGVEIGKNYLNSVTPKKDDRIQRSEKMARMIRAQREGGHKNATEAIALEEMLAELQTGVYQGEDSFEQMSWNDGFPLIKGGSYILRETEF